MKRNRLLNSELSYEIGRIGHTAAITLCDAGLPIPAAAGSQVPLLYTLSLLIVFLCLAALYESWTIPTAAWMSVIR